MARERSTVRASVQATGRMWGLDATASAGPTALPAPVLAGFGPGWPWGGVRCAPLPIMGAVSVLGIETRNLEKTFDRAPVVQALDLRVSHGNVYALLGPNGAGKTTTIRMLAGLIAPSGGEATVADVRVEQDERSLSRLHSRVGVLTEAPGMWERLSAEQNLRVYARLYALADPVECVHRYLQRVGLWARRSDPVAKYSKGMRQRLAIARAILHEPPVLFLDEPTSGLDPEAAAEVRELIDTLRGQGRTILLCTHNLTEAEELSDRIGIFRGRLLIEGSPEELRRAVFRPEVEFRFRPPDSPHGHEECVRTVPGVEGVWMHGELLRVAVKDPVSALPELTRALVMDGASLLSVGERVRSLEEVYLRVLERE
ncbi:MAG: ABC transporter ATP-binding protein [Chloroflexota bacterium]|nr:ABC transporter ATP-binding protein [Chloroflexota bacterium]